jgi:hypothetical protein
VSKRRIAVTGIVLTLMSQTAVIAEAASDDADGPAGEDASMRDPLRPPGYGASATSAEADETRFDASAWRLLSTLVSAERRSAIINGRNVREGGRVGGATVIAIESDTVTLDYRGRRFTIGDSSPSVRSHERSGDTRP